MGKIAIAIDGPAGSGKSTIAKLVAFRFHYLYIDTGAMYRAITLKALRQGLSLSDPETLTRLASVTRMDLNYSFDNAGSSLQVLLDGEDVNTEIRSLEVTNNVSKVAAVPGVRRALVKLQQELALGKGVVMDGRDIGTVVLPAAELKIFLTASAAERGKRRWLELKQKGIETSLEELILQIQARDELDSNRETDPLRQAPDALYMDTTNDSIGEVAEKVIRLAMEKGAVPYS